jgi:hypothetical protein
MTFSIILYSYCQIHRTQIVEGVSFVISYFKLLKSIIEFSELVSSDTCSGKKRKNLFGGLFALNVLKCNGFHLTREGVVI